MRLLLKRLWLQVSSRRKKQLILVMMLMLTATVAEVVSIGAVIPFLGVLANPETVFNLEYTQVFISNFGISEPKQLLLPFTIVFASAALLTGLVRIALLWGQVRLAHAIGADLGYQIYQRTLYQPYTVHVSRNSSEVIAGISTKSDQVVNNVILPLLHMTSSLFMVIMILLALIIIQPVMALSVILGFGIIYIVFIMGTKKRLIRNSHKISQNTNLIIKTLQEGLGGIRDILIDGTQAAYCKSFSTSDLLRRRAIANNQIMGDSPRYGIESLGMVLLSTIAFVLGSAEGGLIVVLPLLGALAIGAQRMLPMLQQAYRAWSNIRGAQIILQDALILLEQPLPGYIEGSTSNSIPFQKNIQLNYLGFRYQQSTPWVLKNINIEIHKGARIGFIGITGSGKSTLLDIIMSLLQPSEGMLKIDGVEINDRNHRGWQSHIAHIPQAIYLSDVTIAENIAFGFRKEEIDYERVISAAKKAQIDKIIQSWDEKYDTLVGECGIRLSGGQRQRIGIARALYKNADVLIFDEATSALDNQTEKAVMDAIDDIHEDITILTVAHRLSTLKNCDLIFELENGTIKRQGAPDEILEPHNINQGVKQ